MTTASSERHQRVATNFGRVAGLVDNWQAPAPVPGWTAESVVDHLVGWVAGFLADGGVILERDLSSDDPAVRWTNHAAAVQALLDSAAAGDDFVHPMVGAGLLGVTLDRIYTTDVLMHTWDLARSAGVEHGLPDDECADILDGMRGIEELLRSSGQYGPAYPVADSAPAPDRLLAFVGRDPQWGRVG